MSWLLASGEVLTGVILVALGVGWTWLFSNRPTVTTATVTFYPVVALLLFVVGTVLVLRGVGVM